MTPRHRRRLGVLVGIALVVPLLSSSTALGAPVDDKRAEAARVQAKLDSLGSKESELAEAFNQARLKVERTEAEIAQAQSDLESANQRFAVAKGRLARYAVEAYTHGGQVPIIEQFTHSDGSDLAVRNKYTRTAARDQRQAIDDLKAAREDLTAKRGKLQTAQKAERAAADQVGAQKSALDKLLGDQRAVLSKVNGEVATLVTQEQERKLADQAAKAQAVIAAGATARVPAAASRAPTAAPAPSGGSSAPVSGSGGGSTAVAAARAQIGKPYLWGGSGPDSFDCSGLTSWAWRAAGVSLPHSSDAQYGATTHVGSPSAPGDLIFYSGHVSIYSGGGTMIEAARTGTNVREVPVRGGYFGVGRP